MSKVLLVADSEWVINQVKAALSESGTEIQEVTDPHMVEDQVEAFEPDIAVIDMQIASMGGMAIVRALRNTEYAAERGIIPTVLLMDRSADTFLAKRAAADAWLLKPFTAQDLRSVVAGLPKASPVS